MNNNNLKFNNESNRIDDLLQKIEKKKLKIKILQENLKKKDENLIEYKKNCDFLKEKLDLKNKIISDFEKKKKIGQNNEIEILKHKINELELKNLKLEEKALEFQEYAFFDKNLSNFENLIGNKFELNSKDKNFSSNQTFKNNETFKIDGITKENKKDSNNENKEKLINQKFITHLSEMAILCAPINFFKNKYHPTLKELWKFFKKIMENFVDLKKIEKIYEDISSLLGCEKKKELIPKIEKLLKDHKIAMKIINSLRN